MEDQVLDENQVLDDNGAIIGHLTSYPDSYRISRDGKSVGFLVHSMEGVRFHKLHPDGTLDAQRPYLFSGTTKFSYKSGIYHGQYLRGRRVGIGRFVFSHSPASEDASFRDAVYHGNFNRDWIMGYGTMTWPNGKKYEGNWLFGKESGEGTITWPDGQVFKGVFANGKINESVKSKFTNVFGKTYTDFFDEKKLQEMFKKDEALHHAEDAELGGNNSRMKRRQSKRRQKSKRRQNKRH